METHADYRKLFDYFKSFPGIGKRQAERFVYHILTKDSNWIASFVREVEQSRKYVHECVDCFRIFKNTNTSETLCERCRSGQLDRTLLAVVEKNIDAENFIEKTKFPGLVFVLGGVFPVIEKKVRNKVRLEELINFVKKEIFQEIIICTSLTNDGIFTGSVIKQKIKELEKQNLKITTLGRGFSTGTELEYADTDTLLNALKNRTENLF